MDITATYSPEDNKLRLYPSERLDQETFEKVKAAGYKWAPRQGLFVAPKWTTAREDLAIELAGEIEPEEMTLAERAAAKAERLEGIAHKRANEADAFARAADDISQRFAMGQPILVGHHSERIDGTFPDWRRVMPLEKDTFAAAAFNPDLLVKFQKACKILAGCAMQIAAFDANGPARIKFNGATGFTGVIMPVRF